MVDRLSNANQATGSDSSTVERPASLKPKEHGAYAILAIPLATGLIAGGPTVVGLLIAVASAAGFLSHEPLLVAWGHRGGRAQRASAQAKSRLIIQLAIALIAGTMALLLASMPVRFALLGCLPLAVVSFVVALQGLHRSLPGQLWGVVSLSAPSVPILLAGDLPTETAFTIWLIWLLGFAATTVAVRGVIASQKRQSRAVLWAVLVFVSLAALVSQIEGFASVLAVTPMVLPSWYLMLAPPSPKHLKRVGWILVGATLTKAFWSRSSFEGV